MTSTDIPRDIVISPLGLEGILHVPDDAIGLVIFAHGSGSSRLSPRNQFVASGLQKAGIATLLFDLLTPEEAMDRENVFDIRLLSERLILAHDWLLETFPDALKALPIGYFGSSTGAAAALIAAARKGDAVTAVVSRGGRPDLAETALKKVTAPTLLIVGGNDFQVIELNEWALERLACDKELRIIPGATHLFEEPGTLEAVTENAAEWFGQKFKEAS